MIRLYALAFVASLLLSYLYRRLAVRWQIVDVPRGRSAHRAALPRGGGVPLLVAFAVGCVAMQFLGRHQLGEFSFILLLAGLLATTGFLDDRGGLGVSLRLSLYTVACTLAAAHLLAGQVSWSLLLPVAFALLWLLNLYNFMDGTDGLAATEAVFVGVAAALLGAHAEVAPLLTSLNLLLASACAGFLVLNWPRAKLFMGDSGSIALGFLFGCLALGYALEDAVWVYVWLILLAAFVADATLTLLWRMAVGQRFMESHDLHAYQRLSRHWGSHARVLLLLLAIDLLWLLPLACLALWFPGHAPFLLLLAYLPLLLGVWKTLRVNNSG